jgi:hypothetical protein
MFWAFLLHGGKIVRLAVSEWLSPRKTVAKPDDIFCLFST